MRIIRNVLTVGGFTASSRVFGLIREMLMAHFMGASIVTDAFFVAFKFPNFFRRIFGEGAFNAAFVPLFSQKLVEEGPNCAYDFAQRAFSWLLLILFIFVGFILVFTPSIIHVLAPGFVTSPERLELVVSFTRITFPYILFISLAAHLSGVLNSMDRFAAAAGVPIILNIIMIGALLWADRQGLSYGEALCWSVMVAGVLQLLWLYGACWRLGVKIYPRIPRLSADVKRLMKLMIPGAIGAGVTNINFFIETIIASYLPAKSITYICYADRLNQLPLAIFGIAIGTALLPMLSRQLKAGDLERAQRNKTLATEFSLQLTIPAAVGLFVLSYPIINLFYGHGLTQQDVQATSYALMAFSLGIPAYVLNKVFITGFFARQDTKTPVIIGSFCILLNIIVSISLMGYFFHVALALSMTISAWVNTILLYVVLKRRQWFFLEFSHVRRLGGVLINSIAMGLIIWGVDQSLGGISESAFTNTVRLFGLICVGILSVITLGVLFRTINLQQFKSALSR